MKLRVFTDGACSGNPGAGGWSAVFNLRNGHESLCGCEAMTTNNRMELTAVVQALRYALSKGKRTGMQVHSDSAYVINAVNRGWLTTWKSNGWKTAKNEDVKNRDLWEQLDELLLQMDVELVKVKGHSGNTFNEMADRLAVEQSKLAQEGRT